MPSVPDACPDCGGQLFRSVWGVRKDDESEPLEDGNKVMRRDGFECVNCTTIQVTRDVPATHEQTHGLPSNAVDNRK